MRSTQGPSWGYLKSQFSRDLVNVWRQMPTKWLQDRTDGSKTAPGIPPHRAFCGLARNCANQLLAARDCAFASLCSSFREFQWIWRGSAHLDLYLCSRRVLQIASSGYTFDSNNAAPFKILPSPSGKVSEVCQLARCVHDFDS